MSNKYHVDVANYLEQAKEVLKESTLSTSWGNIPEEIPVEQKAFFVSKLCEQVAELHTGKRMSVRFTLCANLSENEILLIPDKLYDAGLSIYDILDAYVADTLEQVSKVLHSLPEAASKLVGCFTSRKCLREVSQISPGFLAYLAKSAPKDAKEPEELSLTDAVIAAQQWFKNPKALHPETYYVGHNGVSLSLLMRKVFGTFSDDCLSQKSSVKAIEYLVSMEERFKKLFSLPLTDPGNPANTPNEEPSEDGENNKTDNTDKTGGTSAENLPEENSKQQKPLSPAKIEDKIDRQLQMQHKSLLPVSKLKELERALNDLKKFSKIQYVEGTNKTVIYYASPRTNSRFLTSDMQRHKKKMQDIFRFRNSDKILVQRNQRNGRLDPRKLATLPTNQLDVFKTKYVVPVEGASIGLLLDSSGSMTSNDKLRKANELAVLFVAALKELPKMQLEVASFTTQDGYEEINKLTYLYGKDQKDPSALLAYLQESHRDNFDEYAIDAFSDILLKNTTYQQKIIFVISDGMPVNSNWQTTTPKTLQKVRRKGITLVHVAIDKASPVIQGYDHRVEFLNPGSFLLDMSILLKKLVRN